MENLDLVLTLGSAALLAAMRAARGGKSLSTTAERESRSQRKAPTQTATVIAESLPVVG